MLSPISGHANSKATLKSESKELIKACKAAGDANGIFDIFSSNIKQLRLSVLHHPTVFLVTSEMELALHPNKDRLPLVAESHLPHSELQ